MAIVLGCGAATGAAAQSLAPYAPISGPTYAPDLSGSGDAVSRMLGRETFAAGGAPVRWNSGEFAISRKDGAVDSVRVSVGGALVTPGGLPLRLDESDFEARDYDVTVVREWPGAVSFAASKVAVKVSPHAGVGMTSQGGSAEAGARMEVSRSKDDKAEQKLKDLGVGDGSEFGDRGRWYVYAAASGRAVGMNMLRDATGWNRAGWTTDPASSLISDAQVGVGWRKGVVQTSFGAVHREVKGQHMIMGQDTKEDTMVAFSMSIKPKR